MTAMNQHLQTEKPVHPPQRITVFQQNGSGESKIRGIRLHGGESFELRTVNIDSSLPPVIDDGRDYLPPDLETDLVLDYLKHPDLSHDLAEMCRRKGIPVVASGKKLRIKEAITPITCCGLPGLERLGPYGRLFGMPEFEIRCAGGLVESVRVLRGAPCGATWEAASSIIGVKAEEAARQMGLISQFHCTANPAGWDPITGKSPVHLAAEFHQAALVKALGII